MHRAILKVTFIQGPYSKAGHGCNHFQLECGHEEVAKASSPVPERKRCKTCRDLSGGAIITRGNVRETWDREQRWPVRTTVETIEETE